MKLDPKAVAECRRLVADARSVLPLTFPDDWMAGAPLWGPITGYLADALDDIERLTAEVARLRAALEGIHALAEDPDNRLNSDMHQIEADARAALSKEAPSHAG